MEFLKILRYLWIFLVSSDYIVVVDFDCEIVLAWISFSCRINWLHLFCKINWIWFELCDFWKNWFEKIVYCFESKSAFLLFEMKIEYLICVLYDVANLMLLVLSIFMQFWGWIRDLKVLDTKVHPHRVVIHTARLALDSSSSGDYFIGLFSVCSGRFSLMS